MKKLDDENSYISPVKKEFNIRNRNSGSTAMANLRAFAKRMKAVARNQRDHDEADDLLIQLSNMTLVAQDINERQLKDWENRDEARNERDEALAEVQELEQQNAELEEKLEKNKGKLKKAKAMASENAAAAEKMANVFCSCGIRGGAYPCSAGKCECVSVGIACTIRCTGCRCTTDSSACCNPENIKMRALADAE